VSRYQEKKGANLNDCAKVRRRGEEHGSKSKGSESTAKKIPPKKSRKSWKRRKKEPSSVLQHSGAGVPAAR